VLSAEVHARNVYPPVDPLSSLSRLMRRGAGKNRTREDHLDLAAQLVAALSRARQIRELAELVGTAALGESDRHYLQLVEVFETQLVNQRPDESRTLDQTLDSAWRVAAALPRQELTMLPAALLDAHLDAGKQTPSRRSAGAPGPRRPVVAGTAPRHRSTRWGAAQTEAGNPQP
jgi:V/A-type H+/Na+-transporting ATPase subunit B